MDEQSKPELNPERLVTMRVHIRDMPTDRETEITAEAITADELKRRLDNLVDALAQWGIYLAYEIVGEETDES